MRARKLFLLAAIVGLAACSPENGALTQPERESPTIRVNGVDLVQVKPGRQLELAGQSDTRHISAAEGGVLSTDDAVLVIPAGSLSSDAEISMEAMNDGTMGFQFSPNGLTFSTPVRLEIRADKAALAGVDLSRLAVAGAKDHIDDWQVLGGVYDALNNKITAEISHFSRYALCIQ